MANTPRRPRECEVCGETYRPTYFQQRACGRSCGWFIRWSGATCPITWAVCWQGHPHTTRGGRRCGCGPKPKPRRRWQPIEQACAECGIDFTNQWTSTAVHCSKRCSRRVARRKRRAREQHQQCEWRWSDFMRVARKFGYCCAYCGKKPLRLDPDHVLPLSKGGRDTLANLLPACPQCNSHKRDLTLAEWREDRARRGLPARRTAWSVIDARYSHLTCLEAA